MRICPIKPDVVPELPPILLNIYEFVILAMGRARTTELAKQQRKAEENRRRNLTRICLGSSYERWVSQRDRIGSNNSDFIRHLLDVHDLFCVCSKHTGLVQRGAYEHGKAGLRNEQGNLEGLQRELSHQPEKSPLNQNESCKTGNAVDVSLMASDYAATSSQVSHGQKDNTTEGQSQDTQFSSPQNEDTKDQNPGPHSIPSSTDSQPRTEQNTVPSGSTDHVNSWKFVHFPTSWKYGDRLAIDLTFSLYPSMNLMAHGMTRATALHPPDESPERERTLSISNFLELYFTAKMMERRGISVQYSGGASANLYVILQKWLFSFFGINANTAEVRLKAVKIVQYFQRLEGKYNQQLNEKNFECLGDFLLSSWSSFWLLESNKRSAKSKTDSNSEHQSKQLVFADAQEDAERNELDFRVYRNSLDENIETGNSDERQESKNKAKSPDKNLDDSFDIKKEPLDDDVTERAKSPSNKPTRSSHHQLQEDTSQSEKDGQYSGSGLVNPVSGEKSDAQAHDLSSGSSRRHLSDIVQQLGTSQMNRASQDQTVEQGKQNQQSGLTEDMSDGDPVATGAKRKLSAEDFRHDDKDEDHDMGPTPSKQANVT